MAELWDAFLEDYGQEIWDWSIREILKVFWYYCQGGPEEVYKYLNKNKGIKDTEDKEIEQLKTEKEWLIANWAEDKHYINNLWAVDQHSMDEHKEKILNKMQQALKILDENGKLDDKIKNKEEENETV